MSRATISGVILDRDPDTVRGPDVALYEDAKKYSELHPKYGETPPILAVEVLSPNDRADQVLRKIADYLSNGVRLLWVIDMELPTVTVYRPDKQQYVVTRTGKLTGEDVLPDLECSVSEFFYVGGEEEEPRPKEKKKGRS